MIENTKIISQDLSEKAPIPFYKRVNFLLVGFNLFGSVSSTASLIYLLFVGDNLVNGVKVVSIVILIMFLLTLLGLFHFFHYSKKVDFENGMLTEKLLETEGKLHVKDVEFQKELRKNRLDINDPRLSHLISQIYKICFSIHETIVAQNNPATTRKFIGPKLTLLTNAMRDIVSKISGKKCSVTLLRIVPPVNNRLNANKITVEVLRTDSDTYSARADCNISNQFKSGDVLPIYKLLKEPATYFKIANIKEFEEKGGKFINDYNKDCKKFYNSCLVFPLKQKSAKHKSSPDGFFWIDSNEDDFINNDIIKSLEIIVKMSFVLVRSINKLSSIPASRPLQNKNNPTR